MKYLGHIIGHGVIRTDPDKIKAIVEFQLPKSVRQLRRFLGVCGWYCRFIHNFATVTTPLTNVLCKGRRFEWTNDGLQAFHQLKKD